MIIEPPQLQRSRWTRDTLVIFLTIYDLLTTRFCKNSKIAWETFAIELNTLLEKDLSTNLFSKLLLANPKFFSHTCMRIDFLFWIILKNTWNLPNLTSDLSPQPSIWCKYFTVFLYCPSLDWEIFPPVSPISTQLFCPSCFFKLENSLVVFYTYGFSLPSPPELRDYSSG